MTYGYQCEDCEVAAWPSTTRAELKWLKDRVHVVREVAKHTHGGLDTWIVEALAFLDDHQGHSILIVTRK